MHDAAALALATDKLKQSDLTLADAKELGIEVLAAAQTAKLGESFKPLASLKLNYHGIAGEPLDFYRVRYLERENSVATLTKKGAQRYVQPPDTLPRVYLPLAIDWKKRARDTTVALHITEGELKAACASKHGFACLGLGGVYSWKSQRRGVPFVPELEAIEWKERTVYITFDSDAATKPQVARAACELCDELAARGALPKMVTLPDVEGFEKTGLDDFIVSQGAKAYDSLLADAKPYGAAKEMWRLNGEVLFVRDPGLIIVVETGQRLAPRTFKESAYANRHYYETTVTAKGEPKITKKPLAPDWLAWEQRAEVQRAVYRPGEPRITSTGEWNTWTGWGCEPKRGSVRPWRELLDHLFHGDDDARRWFEAWCAYPLQNPGAKLYTAAVLWGVRHGTGKSLVGASLMRIYGRNSTEIDDEHLNNSYNEWAENKQFVMGDDVMPADDRRRSADRIKHMITRQRLRLNPKYVPSYEVDDCINYYFTSNHPDAFALEDTDRRFFVHEIVGEPKPRAFYDEYDAWLNSPEGPAALFYHLLSLGLGKWSPKEHAPMTAGKRAMIEDNKSDLAAWVLRLRSDPDAVLRIGSEPIDRDLFTPSQLLGIYDPEGRTRVTANGLGRELKRALFPFANGGATVGTKKFGVQRFYVVRNAEKWQGARPAVLAAHIDGEDEGSAPKQRKPKF